MGEFDRISIKEWSKDDRPREKLLEQGPHVLSDAELIAILIRSGSTTESAVDLSKRVFREVGNELSKLARLSPQELMRFNGIGEAKALSIIAALELGRRRRDTEPVSRIRITSSEIAHQVIRPKLVDLNHEEFWVILLSRSNEVIRSAKIGQGGVHGTVADPKVIFKTALENNAPGIILCHNHPSGQLRPSTADIRLTRQLIEGAKLLEMVILDHLIVTADGYYSFADEGRI